MMKATVDQSIVDSPRDDDSSRWESVTRSLGKNQYVGFDTQILAIKPLPTTPKPCLSLIHDQQRANILRECLQLGEVLACWIDHPSCRDNRLNDNCRHVLCAVAE